VADAETAEDTTFRNDIPGLERLLVGFFIIVGGPIIGLVWTGFDQIPAWAGILFGLGMPVVLIYLVSQLRRRVRVVLPHGAPLAVVSERRRWRWETRQVGIAAVRIDVGEDIDGDPYGKLEADFSDGTSVTITEGNDLERLEADLKRIRSWMG
jgi:hypothetical protein